MQKNSGYSNKPETEDLKKVFYSQSYEILEDLQDTVLSLEDDPKNDELLKAVQRDFHTLKGDSNMVGLSDVGSLCHRTEDILTSIRNHERLFDADAISLILKCIDKIDAIIKSSESGTTVEDIQDIMEALDTFINSASENGSKKQGKKGHTEYQILQMHDALSSGLNLYVAQIIFHPLCAEKGVAAFMVNERMNTIGEVISSSPEIDGDDIEDSKKVSFIISTSMNIDEIHEKAHITGITEKVNVSPYIPPQESILESMRDSELKREMIRVEVSKVDMIMNLVGELIIGRSMIDKIVKDIEDGQDADDIAAKLFDANSYMERTVSDLQNGIMKMRMVPINRVLKKFPKIVRNLSAEKGKKVHLLIHGEETELDKGIVDKLGEPLAHMIRNSIDHGIEEPSARSSVGKPEEGVIALTAYHESTHVVIEISDDGKGIDIEKLKQEAVEKGFHNRDEIDRFSDVEISNIIFLPGLSTSNIISETSGRGIGMDAVKATVDNLKGSIEVQSTPGNGTKFKLRLPLTLAIMKALLFEAGEKLYAIPVSAISEVSRTMVNDLVTVDGMDTLRLRDQIISVIHLQELFGLSGTPNKKKFTLILGVGEKKIGLLVDRVVGQQELVIKAINDKYTPSGLVTGASILGDGRVILILDTPAIFRKGVEDEKKMVAQA